ncbi:MAG: hypothetical protein ACJ768_14805, partial [Gaiellaceae bacterium]
ALRPPPAAWPAGAAPGSPLPDHAADWCARRVSQTVLTVGEPARGLRTSSPAGVVASPARTPPYWGERQANS